MDPRYSVAGTKQYFRACEFIAGKEAVPPVWGGKGAARLGLEGIVDRKVFHRLLDNKTPDAKGKMKPHTRTEGKTKNGKGYKNKAGDEMTFNAPKGVSLASQLSPNGQALIDAFEESALEAIAAEAEPYAMTRVRKGGKNEDRVTGELTVILFTHLTNRDGDPHLHGHPLAINQTWDPVEARWKALKPTAIYDRRPEIQADFHRRFRAKVEAIGFPTVRRGKLWDIDLPRSTIWKFSERRAAIKRKLKEWGKVTPARRKKVGLMTRDPKPEVIDVDKLLPRWRERLTKREERLFENLQARPKVGRPMARQRALVARLVASAYTAPAHAKAASHELTMEP